jgi:hypothetical protein
VRVGGEMEKEGWKESGIQAKSKILVSSKSRKKVL